MADTGAPWNLPYPLPTDLVRDGADAIKDLAEATATGLSNIPVLAGIGSNVVQTLKTDTFSMTSSTFADVTGLTATITPSSDTSKVLVLVSLFGMSSGTHTFNGRVLRGATPIGIGDASGGTTRSTQYQRYNLGDGDMSGPQFWAVLDSPGVDTATTYTVQVRTSSGTAWVNRTASDAVRASSSITLIEVAA